MLSTFYNWTLTLQWLKNSKDSETQDVMISQAIETSDLIHMWE